MTGAMFLLVWPLQPKTLQPLLLPRWCLWQRKTRCSRRWYTVKIWIFLYEMVLLRLLCSVIWSRYSSWSGWQTESRARGCHRPQTGHRAGIYWAGLHLTLLDWGLIYRTTFLCVCLSAHVCTCVPMCLYTHPKESLSYQLHQAFIRGDIFCHSLFKPNTRLCVLSPHCGTLRGLTYATCQ